MHADVVEVDGVRTIVVTGLPYNLLPEMRFKVSLVPDGISTSVALALAADKAIVPLLATGLWTSEHENEEFPRKLWQAEVAAGKTCRGYWQWVFLSRNFRPGSGFFQ